MSTQCVVEFKAVKDNANNITRVNDRIQLYVHSDGYPTYMVPLLKAFLKWNRTRNDDITYTAANFIYWYKKKALKEAKAFAKEWRSQKHERLAGKEWPKHKDFLLQREHIGVGVLPLMTKKEMYYQCISYHYEVHLSSPTHKNDTIVDKFTNLGTDYIAIDVYRTGNRKRDERIEVTIK